MKIFSNFDTSIRRTKFQEYQEQYGPENVIMFGRSKLYRAIKVVIPTFFLVAITVLGLVWLYSRLWGDYMMYFVIAFVLFDLVWLFPIIGKYMDYKLDFIIVTPDVLIMYDQWGIFKRNIISTNEKSIKTISVQKSWLLYSIFNNGDLVFLTEWDAANNGEITLRRVPKPEKRRKEIARIMSKDLENKTLNVKDPIA